MLLKYKMTLLHGEKKLDISYKPVSEKQFVKVKTAEKENVEHTKKEEHIEMSSVSTSPHDEISTKIKNEIPNNTLFEKDIIEDKNIIEKPNDEELISFKKYKFRN